MQALNTDQFWTDFVKSCNQLESEVGSLTIGTVEKFTEFRAQYAELQTFATDAARFLPPYDVKRSQTQLDNLKKQISAAEIMLLPKKKFSFKDKPTSAAPKAAASVAAAVEIEPARSVDAKVEASGSILIEGLKHETRVLTADNVRPETEGLRAQILVRNCSHVELSIPSLLGSVRLENLSHCTVYLGPISTSLYLESCDNCIVHALSHQMRIHQSHHCSMYIGNHSTPIIEACTDMGFAPYYLSYAGLPADIEAANLTSANQWDKVVDFLWHRNVPSPNWRVIPEDEQLRTTPGGAWESAMLSS